MTKNTNSKQRSDIDYRNSPLSDRDRRNKLEAPKFK